ncbi:hypothetical protein G9A89_010941 [Geosiphon pyriformis]|nr:hypothetical protein G9A89_010941 [Geosiphon pyriformis]
MEMINITSSKPGQNLKFESSKTSSNAQICKKSRRLRFVARQKKKAHATIRKQRKATLKSREVAAAIENDENDENQYNAKLKENKNCSNLLTADDDYDNDEFMTTNEEQFSYDDKRQILGQIIADLQDMGKPTSEKESNTQHIKSETPPCEQEMSSAEKRRTLYEIIAQLTVMKHSSSSFQSSDDCQLYNEPEETEFEISSIKNEPISLSETEISSNKEEDFQEGEGFDETPGNENCYLTPEQMAELGIFEDDELDDGNCDWHTVQQSEYETSEQIDFDGQDINDDYAMIGHDDDDDDFFKDLESYQPKYSSDLIEEDAELYELFQQLN